MRSEEKKWLDVIESWEWEAAFWRSAKEMLQVHSDQVLSVTNVKETVQS